MNINLDIVLMIQLIQCVHAEVETTDHFLLRCHFYSTLRLELFENLEEIDPYSLNLNEEDQVNILLYGYNINKTKSFN